VGALCLPQPAASNKGAIQITVRNGVILSTSSGYCKEGAN
jgi:hypothetical protein